MKAQIKSVYIVLLILITSCSSNIEDILSEKEKTENLDKTNNTISSSMKSFQNKKHRGFNISPWNQNNELDEIINQTQANILRLSFTGGVKLMSKISTTGITSNPTATYEFNENAFYELKRILDWAQSRGDVQILIDPHTFPGFANDFTTDSNDLFWKDPRWRNHLYKLWDKIICKSSSKSRHFIKETKGVFS